MNKRKVLSILLLALITVTLAVSCSSNIDTPAANTEELAYVTFGNGHSRELGTSYKTLPYGDLYWFYTADKDDNYGTTGETLAEKPVSATYNEQGEINTISAGLGGQVGPFSQGKWNFQLFAYKNAIVSAGSVEYENCVYQSDVVSVVLKGGDVKNVPVSVTPQGSIGLVNLSEAWFEWANSSDADGNISVTVELVKDGSTPNTYFFGPLTKSGVKYTFASNDDNIQVNEGYYTCTVNAYMEGDVNVSADTVNADATPLATQTLGLRVYGNATTYITGNLTEGIFSEVVFKVAEQDMKVFVPTETGSADITDISVTPSGGIDQSTRVTFSSGALPSLSIGETLQLDVKVTPVESANEKFNITGTTDGNKSAFAGIDITLMKTTANGQPVAVDSFNNDSTTTATVTTYIATGLSNVSVHYTPKADDPENIKKEYTIGTEEDFNNEEADGYYDSQTGILVFKTDHFSEFYILADCVALNVNKNIGYKDLVEAINSANSGDTIKLYDDIHLTSILEIKKSIKIDGDRHSIYNTANRVLTLREADIAVELYNLGIISECTDNYDVRGISIWDVSDNSSLLLDGCTVSASFYAINIIPGANNLNITIKNGTVAAGWAAINTYSNNSTFTIENSTLRGLNDKGESTWNDYATIVFDGNGLYNKENIGVNGSGNTMTIKKSTVYASSESSNNQAWLSIQYGARDNHITLDSETKIIDGSDNDQSENITIGPFVGYDSTKKRYLKSYDVHSLLTVDSEMINICYHGEIDYSEILDNGFHVPFEGCKDIEWSNVVTITPAKASTTTWNSDTLYYLAPGQYNDFSAYLHGKENVGFCALPEATFTKVVIGYHAGQDSSLSAKQNSTLTIKGFNVDGELMVNSADQKVVIEGNTAAQITLKTHQFDNMNIQVINNTLTGGSDKASQQYGIYIVPNKSDYDLNISENTFSNIYDHAIAVQGNGDGSAVTAANSIIVQNNTFESYGLNRKNGRAAFKIWADTKYAPTENGDITDPARSLIQKINDNNTFSGSHGENCVLGNFYGKLVSFNNQ